MSVYRGLRCLTFCHSREGGLPPARRLRSPRMTEYIVRAIAGKTILSGQSYFFAPE